MKTEPIAEVKAYIANDALPADVLAALDSLKVRLDFGNTPWEYELSELLTMVSLEIRSRSTLRRLKYPLSLSLEDGFISEVFPAAPGKCENELKIKVYVCNPTFAAWVTHIFPPGPFKSSREVWKLVGNPP